MLNQKEPPEERIQTCFLTKYIVEIIVPLIGDHWRISTQSDRIETEIIRSQILYGESHRQKFTLHIANSSSLV